MTQVHQTVSAGSRTINVKPLPEEGNLQILQELLVDFNFNVTTIKNNLMLLNRFRLKVEVTGKGNLKLFELPKLHFQVL